MFSAVSEILLALDVRCSVLDKGLEVGRKRRAVHVKRGELELVFDSTERVGLLVFTQGRVRLYRSEREPILDLTGEGASLRGRSILRPRRRLLRRG